MGAQAYGTSRPAVGTQGGIKAFGAYRIRGPGFTAGREICLHVMYFWGNFEYSNTLVVPFIM